MSSDEGGGLALRRKAIPRTRHFNQTTTRNSADLDIPDNSRDADTSLDSDPSDDSVDPVDPVDTVDTNEISGERP